MSVAGLLPLLEVASVRLDSSADSVTFGGLALLCPGGSRHLLLRVNAATTVAGGEALVRFNDDASAAYDFSRLSAIDDALAAESDTGLTAAPSVFVGAVADGFAASEMFMPNALTADGYAVGLCRGGSGSALGTVTVTWANTAAVDSILLLPPSGLFAAGSVFTLYVVDETYAIDGGTLSADGTFTFASIPDTYEHLALVHYTRSSRLAGTIDGDHIRMWINGDETLDNYYTHRIGGEVTTIVKERLNQNRLGWTSTEREPAGYFGGGVAVFYDYADAAPVTYGLQHGSYDVQWHSTQTESGRYDGAGGLASLSVFAGHGPNFKAGSYVGLYGIPADHLDRQVAPAGGADSLTLTVPAGSGDDLTVLVRARSDAVAVSDGVTVTLNGSAATYARQTARATRSVAVAAKDATAVFAEVPAASALPGMLHGGPVAILGGSRADRGAAALFSGGPGDERAVLRSGTWDATAAVTSITVAPVAGRFTEGSVVELRNPKRVVALLPQRADGSVRVLGNRADSAIQP